MEEEKWDDTKIKSYFSATYLLAYLQKHIAFFRVIILFQTFMHRKITSNIKLLAMIVSSSKQQ
jgi:hypothetical protein